MDDSGVPEATRDYEDRFRQGDKTVLDTPVFVDRGPLRGLAIANGYVALKAKGKTTKAGLVLNDENSEGSKFFVVYGASAGMWADGVFRKSYLKVGDVVLMDPVRANQRGGCRTFLGAPTSTISPRWTSLPRSWSLRRASPTSRAS